MTSAYRTALWLPQPRGFQVPVLLTWPAKLTADVLDYSLDLTNWLADESDTISGTPTVSTTVTGLTIGTVSVSGSVVTVWLSAGTTGATYGVNVVITTAGGRTETFQVLLPIGSDASIAAPTTAYAIPAASGALLGGSGTAQQAAAVAVGTGLTLTAGTLSVSTSNFNTSIVAWWASLPTTIPSTSGQPWNNGGALSFS